MITYEDRPENSIRVDVQPPWTDLPQSALGSVRSQTPSKMWHTKCIHHKRYQQEALVIMHENA